VATFRQKVAIGAFFVGKRSKQWPLFAEIVAIVSLHKQCGQIDHIVIAQFWLSCTLQNGQQDGGSVTAVTAMTVIDRYRPL
jgi:hypothetical protein